MELAELYFDVSLLLWCCSLVLFTLQGLCSAYVPLLMVAFPLVAKILLASEFKHRGKGGRGGRASVAEPTPAVETGPPSARFP